MNRFKPCERVVSLTGRSGRVQHPWVWNAELPGYCLVLFDGNRMPRWIRIDQLLPDPQVSRDVSV
jgi:hypothetical protein